MQALCSFLCSHRISNEHVVHPATKTWRTVAPLWHSELKVGFDTDCQVRRQISQRERARRRTSLKNIRRSKNTPLPLIIHLHFAQSLAPAENAIFTRVDFLSATNQADADTPITVTRHQLEKQSWLRRGPFELLHALLFIPGSLRLVENDNVLMGRILRRTTKTFLKKVIDVLDSGARLIANGPQALHLPCAAAAQVLIS